MFRPVCLKIMYKYYTKSFSPSEEPDEWLNSFHRCEPTEVVGYVVSPENNWITITIKVFEPSKKRLLKDRKN